MGVVIQNLLHGRSMLAIAILLVGILIFGLVMLGIYLCIMGISSLLILMGAMMRKLGWFLNLWSVISCRLRVTQEFWIRIGWLTEVPGRLTLVVLDIGTGIERVVLLVVMTLSACAFRY